MLVETSGSATTSPTALEVVVRLSRAGAERDTRAIATECPVAISFCGIGYAVMMATPLDLEDYAVGFARSERLIDRIEDISSISIQTVEHGLLLDIDLVPELRDRIFERVRHRVGESSCGICGIENLDQALRPLPKVGSPPQIAPDRLFAALATLAEHQPLNAETGAVHAAAFFDAHANFVSAREDVGRHNAFDKLIGDAMRQGVDLADGFALLSARCSYELVEKAALAGITMLVTVSAPTTLAVERAGGAGLKLIALARPDCMLMMTDPARCAPEP